MSLIHIVQGVERPLDISASTNYSCKFYECYNVVSLKIE